jgi:SAM-dependent methyltransferase
MQDFNKKYERAAKKYLSILDSKRAALPADTLNLRSLGNLYDYKKYIEKIISSTSQKTNILDWGCGNGHISFILREMGRESVTSYCVSPDKRTLDFLKQDLGLDVVVSENLIDLPFETQTYEIILSSGVLEHVNEYGGYMDVSLKELLRICLSGGKIYIWRLPFAWSIWEYIRYVQGRWVHPDRYTVQQLQNLESKFPLKLVQYELDGFLFFRLRAMFMRTCSLADMFNYFEKLMNLRFFHFLLNDIFVVFEKIDESKIETD